MHTTRMIVDGCMGQQDCIVEIMDESDKKGLRILRELTALGDKFRITPIVDDDFCQMRDQFDSKLEEAKEWCKKHK